MAFFTSVIFIGHLLAASIAPAAAEATRPAAAPMVSVPTMSLMGQVTTVDGAPLPGVVVVVKGTANATSTNGAGEFLVTISEAKSLLLLKCVGYHDRTVEVTDTSPLTVTMYSTTAPVPLGVTMGADESSKVLKYAEEMPSFPGGDAAYRAYIRQNARYPEEAILKRQSGTVFVSFVVDEMGRITDTSIGKGASESLNQEALRLIRLMPWWSPGRVAGKAVKVSRVLPVPFQIRAAE